MNSVAVSFGLSAGTIDPFEGRATKPEDSPAMRFLRLSLKSLTLAILMAKTGLHAPGQDWVNSIFPDRNHEFGTVAKGSKLRYSFKVVNVTDKELHIAGYETKCGCTDVKIGADTIPPGTQTTIEATLDTTNFTGLKPSGLTLVIDRPSPARVELNMTCFIRADVTLQPGQLDFGSVKRTDGPSQTMNLQYLGGNADFRVTGSQHHSPRLKVKITEESRANGQANYKIVANLEPTGPLGFYKDQITLKTNDPASPEIPIFVTGQIQGLLSASPSVMNLGQVAKGALVQKTVILKSEKPFVVKETKASKGEVTVAASNPPADQPVRTLNITYKAPDKPGPDHAVLEITSDIPEEPPARINLFATVMP